MLKGKIAYKVFVYLFTFLIIIGGGILYAVLQTKPATDAENSSTSVYAEDVYGSGVHYIHPNQDVISLWDGVSSEAPEGMGTPNSPYLIASAANLKYFQQNYSTFNSTYLLQTVNIDLQNFEWTAITEGQYYYDGGGHTIYNLYQTSASSNKGLFYWINNGYLKNLNVVGANLTRESTSSNFSRAAVFVTLAYGTSSSHTLLENLHATNVVISTKIASGTDTGGIVGRSEYVDVKNCSFDGDIYVEANISASTYGFSVAGIVGCNTGAMTIENCSCFGNVLTKLNDTYTTLTSYVGGIYGGAGSGTATITNCVNYANIQATSVNGATYVGGILAKPDSSAIVSYCVNYGNLYSESSAVHAYVGGIVGRLNSASDNISCCANYGNLYAYAPSWTYAGGIAGSNYYGTISNVFNAGNMLCRETTSGENCECGGIVGTLNGGSDKVINISSTLSVGTVASYTSNINALGGSFGFVVNDSVSISYVYHLTDVITNGHWETAYYMSDTSKITGLGGGNLYDGHGPTTASISSLDGQHVVMPTTVGGVSINCTSSGGVTSANAKVTTANSAPTGLSGFSTDYWDFSQVGQYPRLKNMPTATNLKAETKQIKLVTTGTSKIYDGTEQEQQAEVCTYELKGFENSDPTSYWDGITTTMPNGKGTQADPYLIESAANLAWVSANSQTSTGLALNKYYVQCVNIDLNNMFWTPINESGVSGKIYYDGNYHTIKNLNILQTTNVYVGLFGCVNGYVKNLGIESGKIVAGTSVRNVGTICSCLYNDGEISNCYNKAKIYASVASNAQVGGIVSNQGDNSIIKNCWNAGDIYGYAGAQYVGGIVAVNGWGGVTTNCVNTAKIVLAGSNSNHVGGIVGSGGADGCVNYGDITTSGAGNIKNAYIGGICGSCYFDQECVIGSNYNYGSLSGLIGYCSKAGGIVGNYDSDGENSMAVYSYYNSQVAGFNITAGCALKDFTLTNTMNFTTIELVVTAENTKPTGVAVSDYFNYFKGSFPSVKSKIGNMTFYQKVIDENQAKTEISCWNGSYDTNYVVAPTLLNSGAENSETNPYIIDSAAKLAYISKYYNASNVSGKYFKQTVDIDLCGYNWTPINFSNSDSYTYNYDGDNHTIYNIYIEENAGSGSYAGLFGRFRGSLKNLTLNGGSITLIKNVDDYCMAGAFVGHIYGVESTITNCHNIGVRVCAIKYPSTYDLRVGGIVGSINTQTTIQNCSNTGAIYGFNFQSTASAAGGIAGICSPGTIQNCVNYGFIKGVSKNGNQTGGIVGRLSDSTVSGCENYGTVMGYDIDSNDGYSGGIVGKCWNNGTITKCYNAGEIYGYESRNSPDVGGIVARIHTPSGNTCTISNCYSTGSIGLLDGNTLMVSVGGVVGLINAVGTVTITNCYFNYEATTAGHITSGTTFLSTTSSSNIYGNIYNGSPTITSSSPLSTAQMKSASENTQPSGLTSLSANDWSFNAGQYPRIKAIPEQNYSYNLNGSRSLVNTNSVQGISVWDGTSTAPSLLYSGAPNSEANPYIIDSAMKLAWMSANVDTAKNKYYKQTIDIDLDSRAWMPISQSSNVFYYDGDNHTIYNINVNRTSTNTDNWNGLFGKLGAGSYIKNLTLNGGQVIATTVSTGNSVIVGAFVGEFFVSNSSIYGGYIENCHNLGVTVSGSYENNTNSSKGCYVGGIMGIQYHNIAIKNCTNTGDVYGNGKKTTTGSNNIGGISGYSLVGTVIENCVNYGNVRAHADVNGRIGGISGYCKGAITSCANYGNVIGENTRGNTEPHIGGIVGILDNGTVSYSINFGDVLGCEYASTSPNTGGVAGGIYTNSTIQYCFSTGALAYPSDQGWGYMGGVVGLTGTGNSANNVIKNCYYDYQKVNQGSFGAGYSYLPANNDIGLLYGNNPGSANTVTDCSPLTTNEMQGLTTSMAGFSSDIWEFSENDYPRLKSQGSLVSVWDGETDTKPLGQGTEANPYIIASAANLAYLSDHYNDDDIKGKYFKQVVDIDLDNHEWTPINSSGASNVYYYNGNNHKIYNLSLVKGTSGHSGLFLHIAAGSYIKNLTIQYAMVTYSPTSANYQYVGTFVATASGNADNRVVLENLHAVGVKFNITTSATPRVGGIVGQTYYTTIKNCSISGDITYMSTATSGTGGLGGIGGWAHYTDSSAAKGYTVVENCVNDASIYYSGSGVCGGGIFGWIQKEEITNCVNNGNIFGTAGNAYANIGGIVGGGQPTTTNCVNTGNILLENGNVGGIAGTGSSSLENCYSIGSVGAITDGKVGGLMGNRAGGTITNSYYNSDNIVNNFGQTVAILAARAIGNGTNVSVALTTSQMIVTSDGSAPSGMSGFTTDNWEFYVGGYPIPKGLKIENKTISYWDGSSSEAPIKGDGSAGNPYQIATAANLSWLSDNAGTLSGKYFIQTVDIDLCGHLWTPISIDDGNQRRYFYDGGNHTIYNINVNVVETEKGVHAGLFSQMHEFGYIKNLTLENGRVYGESTYSGGRVGAFVGSVVDNNTTIYLENLHNKNVTVIGKGVNGVSIGGIGGCIKSFQIKNCSNSGDVVSASGNGGSAVMGGITSYLWGGDARQVALIENCVNTGKIYNTDATAGIIVAGGIVGNSYTENLEHIVRNCVNYGDIKITNKNYWYVGGLCGSISKYSKIENCINYGNLTALDDEGTVSGAAHVVGGVVGRIGTDNDSVNITNCMNYGEIYTRVNGTTTWSLYTGGIVGVAQVGHIKNCCNFGDVYSYYQTTCGGWHYAGGVIASVGGSGLSFENCYNVASVMAGGKACGLAGVVGQRSSTNSPYDTYINCYYNTDTIGSGTPKWEGTTQVPTSWAGCIVYTSTPLTNYADVTNCGGLTTAQMQSSANGTRPTGMVGFTQENWNFLKGAYPSLGLLAYEKIYCDNINAGTASVSVALGKNSGYSGVLSASYTINQATNVWTILPTYADFTYASTPSTLVALAKFGDFSTVYKNSSNVTVTISNASNAGTYSVTLTVAATDNYTGLQTTLTFTINPIDLTDNANLHVNFDQTEYVYDGNAHTPTETVTYG